MVISIRMTDKERKLAEAYAKLNGTNLSDIIKILFLKKLKMNMISL